MSEIKYPNVEYFKGYSHSKVHAINRDIPTWEWDVLVLMSDDMICQKKNWDKIILDEMNEHFPNSDGVLWHNDGYVGKRLNTMCIIGRKYFERFKYIYHPSYISLWCDNEFTEVADKLGKQVYFDECLFKHEHYSNNGKIPIDPLMRRNESFYQQDQQNYNKRKSLNFEINNSYT